MTALWTDPIWESYLSHRDINQLRDDVLTAPWRTSQDRAEDSLLMRAICIGDLPAVVALLSVGESASRQATGGFSFLHTAVDLAADSRTSLKRDDALEILRTLLRHGADPNVQGMDGTPLHRAAGAGCVEALRVLIEHGADIEARMLTDGEATPLIHAILMAQRAAIEFLLEAGADRHARCPGYYGNQTAEELIGTCRGKPWRGPPWAEPPPSQAL
jgi:hypothetical protein